MERPKRTPAQKERQRHRENGKYAKVNPCYACGKSAGHEYFSHPLTDGVSPKGEFWDDLAICLCRKCADATQDMLEPEEFIAYANKKEWVKMKLALYRPHPDGSLLTCCPHCDSWDRALDGAASGVYQCEVCEEQFEVISE